MAGRVGIRTTKPNTDRHIMNWIMRANIQSFIHTNNGERWGDRWNWIQCIASSSSSSSSSEYGHYIRFLPLNTHRRCRGKKNMLINVYQSLDWFLAIQSRYSGQHCMWIGLFLFYFLFVVCIVRQIWTTQYIHILWWGQTKKKGKIRSWTMVSVVVLAAQRMFTFACQCYILMEEKSKNETTTAGESPAGAGATGAASRTFFIVAWIMVMGDYYHIQEVSGCETSVTFHKS